MKCVILQPSYIPWRGYFHQIARSDVFVFYDDVQYNKHSWRNRNRIKTPSGPAWLTIPVLNNDAPVTGAPINSIRIDWNRAWNAKHWETLRHVYGKSPYYATYAQILEPFYRQHWELLADFTIELTIALAGQLGITSAAFRRSSELGIGGSGTDRLLGVLSAVGATHYISGPSARSYLQEEKLATAGISLEYMSYDYAPYPQPFPPFDGAMSIVDLLFMTGPDAPSFIW